MFVHQHDIMERNNNAEPSHSCFVLTCGSTSWAAQTKPCRSFKASLRLAHTLMTFEGVEIEMSFYSLPAERPSRSYIFTSTGCRVFAVADFISSTCLTRLSESTWSESWQSRCRWWNIPSIGVFTLCDSVRSLRDGINISNIWGKHIKNMCLCVLIKTYTCCKICCNKRKIFDVFLCSCGFIV